MVSFEAIQSCYLVYVCLCTPCQNKNFQRNNTWKYTTKCILLLFVRSLSCTRFLIFTSSSLIQKFFGCFFRIPTGTQKNSLVLSSRVHGKASGGPSFPWLLLGKKMIILHFYFNACIALSLTFPAPRPPPPPHPGVREKTKGTRSCFVSLARHFAFITCSFCMWQNRFSPSKLRHKTHTRTNYVNDAGLFLSTV